MTDALTACCCVGADIVPVDMLTDIGGASALQYWIRLLAALQYTRHDGTVRTGRLHICMGA